MDERPNDRLGPADPDDLRVELFPDGAWSPDEHGTDFDDAVHVIACQMHATQQNSVDRADHAGDDVS